MFSSRRSYEHQTDGYHAVHGDRSIYPVLGSQVCVSVLAMLAHGIKAKLLLVKKLGVITLALLA